MGAADEYRACGDARATCAGLVKRFVIRAAVDLDWADAAAEFNIWHDPEAARMAFGGVGGAVIAIGLDVTRKTIIDESDIKADPKRVSPASRVGPS